MRRALRPGRLLFVVGALVSVVLSAQVVFGMTDDTIRTGEQSRWVHELVDGVRPEAERSTPADRVTHPATFGGPGPAKTLVMYDGAGPRPEVGELFGIATANLASHFGTVHLMPHEDYTPGRMADFDGVAYVGTSSLTTLPKALVEDVRAGATPVLWAGDNVQLLAGPAGSADLADFVKTYGWDPRASRANTVDRVESIVYDDRPLDRDPRSGAIIAPAIVDDAIVDVLAEAACGPREAEPVPCTGARGEAPGYFPWAIRSENLTFIGELPLEYLSENSAYLAFADLFYDLLAPDTAATRQAAVRIEDVGPESDPADLRRVADYLHAQGIPFQVAVIPVHISKVPSSTTRWYGISLLDVPPVVAALEYMQERGGTLIQHGTSHQYGALDNPYTGATGGDFEFYRAKCSATENPPYEFEPCVKKSWVQLTGTVSQDAVTDHEQRMQVGRQVMREAGLGEPTVFEVPHYAASANTYAAIRTGYEARYDRGQYFAGLVSGRTFADDAYLSQIFPFRVHDVYGSTVLPENIGNVALEEQNNHPARPPQFLIDNAEANLVVRESTASFFFHPFLETKLLDEVVTGIKALGYTFVPATELR